MGIIGSITSTVSHVAHSAVDAVGDAADDVADVVRDGADAASSAVRTASDAADAVGRSVRRGVSTAVDAARAGARFVDRHSRDIAYGLGAAALAVSIFVPGLNIATIPVAAALATGAGAFSAYNVAKDVREGRGPAQIAFDAVGVIPGLGGATRIARIAGGAARGAQLIGPFITAGRVGFTTGQRLAHAL